MKSAWLIPLFWLTACQTGPSYIPPVHQLPGAAIGSIFENARYAARRDKVKASIAPHLDLILSEAERGGGPTMDMSCGVAKVSPLKCAELARQISQDADIYKAGSVDERLEKLTVAFMVHGD
jgi:hypothetical protein